MRQLYFLVFSLGLLLVPIVQYGQAQVPKDSSLIKGTLPKDRLQHNLVEADHFNQGLITNPLDLIHGRLASLVASKPGNDPIGQFDFRVRGVKSFNHTAPQVILDGFPVNGLEGIHPSDIASIQLLADGGSSEWYGSRGGNGLLMIQTKKGKEGATRINYQLVHSFDKLANQPDLISAASYRRLFNYNNGATTVWWDEITRKASAQTHYLSISGGNQQTKYFGSLSYDHVNGIVNNSDMRRLNSRFSFQHQALDDRLQISVTFNRNQRGANAVPYQAFIQATQYNPTSPVYGDGPEFDQYGGYFEQRIWRNYNPVALVDLVDIEQQLNTTLANVQLDYQLLPNLTAGFQYAYQSEVADWSKYDPKTSLFTGLYRNGAAERWQSNRANSFSTTYLQYQQQSEMWSIRGKASMYNQSLENHIIDIRGHDFLTDAFGVHNLGAAQSTANGYSFIDNGRSIRKFRGIAGQLQLSYNNQYGINANVNYEGASHLGFNHRWGLYYGLNAFAKVNDDWQFRASLGRSGNLPQQAYLSQGIYQEGYDYFYNNGDFEKIYYKEQEANPDLQSEFVKEWTIGTDFNILKDRLAGSITYYNNKAEGIIQRHYLDRNTNIANYQYRNSAGVSNAGLEFSLSFDVYKSEKTQWHATLTGTRMYESRMFGYDERWSRGYIGIIGGLCTAPIFRIGDDVALGEIWGYEFAGDGRPVAADGSWNIKDNNGNGYWDQEDAALLGNAMPKWGVAWHNQIRKGKWSVDFLLRGFFGHDIVNHIKSLYSAPSFANGYNILEEGLQDLRGLTDYPEFTERDVENGSFLRMEFLSINYAIPTRIEGLEKIDIFVGAQNLFTITGYSGLNPDFRLADQDIAYAHVFHQPGNPLVPGMDRRNTYPLAKTLYLGIRLGLE